MLVIEARDESGRDVFLTLTPPSRANSKFQLRVYRPKPSKGRWAGDLLASASLSEADAAALKKNL